KRAVEDLKARDKKLVFLTNNSSRTREEYVQKLSSFGLNVDKSEIMSSSYGTALYLSEKAEGANVYVVGEEGLKVELEDAGLEVLPKEEAEGADYVVAGMDRNLTYDKIWGGLSAILSGAEFIATNPDPTYPTKGGLAPGAGASIGALSYSAEREPSKIIGKPSSYMIEASLDIIDVPSERTAIVGDRIDMDVKAGKRAGLTTILVLTGVNSKEDVRAVDGAAEAPDYVLSSLMELLEG
ncbi:hypothetical protein AKJ57_03015, partial [candidate division MSBL1 archaeon SCGC-AAA259A05]